MARNIVNIINFIRGCEPRCEVDLIRPVAEQKAILKEYGFRGTFLLQYDALIDPRFQKLMLEDNEENEVGVWLEIVEPLCVKAGISWRGRFPWDWHANVGFSVGYPPEERERLVDVLFEKFRAVFGYYPRVMASWIIDAHTLRYAHEKYGLDASANCKDQWGTDGYTLWGAYYSGAYYPAKTNVFAVGASKDDEIDVPIFRMLGSDPILQYDAGLDVTSGAASRQGVVTLEPVYHGAGGGEKSWVDWYFREIFNHQSLSYAYTQVGQENSFGWDAMQEGLTYQFKVLARLQNEGVIIETLGESGRWFHDRFETTPDTVTVCHDDFKKSGKRSVWFNSRRYRANLYDDGKGVRLRDMMLFDNGYRERYLCDVEKTSVLQFDTLPVVDGNRFSGHGVLSGLYLELNGKPLLANRILYSECEGKFRAVIVLPKGKSITVTFEENGITFDAAGITGEFSLSLLYDPEKDHVYTDRVGEEIALQHHGYHYGIFTPLQPSRFEEGRITVPAKNRRIRLQLREEE
ncbi:MAG: hypothetical protein IKC63_00685 [Clostridia bacterium]|nr:hypothetical protein [Clostridia bacterium]